MNQDDESRKGGCVLGTIGLFLGLILGFLFDALLEALTGIAQRRGFTTDMRAALLKAFVGGVVGLIGGQLLGAYLGRRTGGQAIAVRKQGG